MKATTKVFSEVRGNYRFLFFQVAAVDNNIVKRQRLHGIQYWAIGKDCCDARGGFWCGVDSYDDAHSSTGASAAGHDDGRRFFRPSWMTRSFHDILNPPVPPTAAVISRRNDNAALTNGGGGGIVVSYIMTR
jgi:hypothetical protein